MCFRFFIFLIMTLMSLDVCCQNNLTVSGRIRDGRSGETLAGAHVALADNGFNTVSNSDGFFCFEKVNILPDTLKVSFVGYKDYAVVVKIRNCSDIVASLMEDNVISDAVTVSASRVSKEMPLTYTEVDAAGISEKDFGSDLPYLMDETPSLVASSDAGGGVGYTGLRVRGSDLTHINVTLNGIPVNDPESHQVYFVDLPDIASSVDNIQIQRGIGTASNGAAAFGASINIKTDEVKAEPLAKISTSCGSFYTWKNTALFSTGRTKNGFIFNGRISKITSNGYIDRAKSDLNSFHLSGIWSDNKNFVKILIMNGKEKTYQAWNGCPKDSIDTNPTYNPSGIMYDKDGNIKGFYDNETDNYNQTYYQAHYARDLDGECVLTAAAFATTGKGFFENFMNQMPLEYYGLPPFVIGSDTLFYADAVQQQWLDNIFCGFQTSLEKKTDKLNFAAGVSFNHFDGKHYGIVTNTEYEVGIDKKWYQNDGDKNYFNIFANASYKINKINIFGEIQYRLIKHSIDGRHEDMRDVTQNHTFNFINPKAGVFYTINDKNNAYFSVAFSNREPTRDIYVYSDEEQISRVKHEKLIDYELGYAFSTQNIQVNANAFFMDYRDQLVQTGEINNVGASVMTNVDKSYRFGIELATAFRLGRFVEIDANISISRSKIKDYTNYVDVYDEAWNYLGQRKEALGTTDISFSPPVVAGTKVTAKPFEGFSVSLSGKYIDKQYIDNTFDESRSLKSYFTTDVLASYRIKQNVFNELSAKLLINNIFNTKYCSNAWVYRAVVGDGEYISDGYFPQAGTTLSVGISIGI